MSRTVRRDCPICGKETVTSRRNGIVSRVLFRPHNNPETKQPCPVRAAFRSRHSGAWIVSGYR